MLLEPNTTLIEKMLMLVNQFGLNHVCAEPEFQYFGKERYDYHFPYLDINATVSNDTLDYEIEFYFRGALDRDFKFKNLFEYLLWASLIDKRYGVIFYIFE